MLVSATVVAFQGSDMQVELVFDNDAGDPLVDIETAATSNWTASFEGNGFIVTGPLEQTAFNTVVLYMGATGDAEGNVLNYAALPSDIGTQSGRMLAAFADRPISE